MNDFWSNFWPNFWSNLLVGTGLGGLLAYGLYRIQQRDNDRSQKRKADAEALLRKRKILSLILKELNGNYENLCQYDPTHHADSLHLFEERNAVVSDIKYELWRAFSDGGELQWINDVDLLDQLASAYYSIQQVQISGKLFFQYSYFDRSFHGPIVQEKLRQHFERDRDLALISIQAAIDSIEKQI